MGDALRAEMCAAGHNIRLLLKKLPLLCAQCGMALREMLNDQSPSPGGGHATTC